MKRVSRKIALCALSLLFTCSVGALGINALATANADTTAVAVDATTVNLTFNTLGLNGSENNDNTFGNDKYYTCIRFTTGVFSGDTNGSFDFSDLAAKASYVGSGNTEGEWGFAPAYSKWAQGYKNDAVFNFFYVWTTNRPANGDKIVMEAGASFTISGTFADGTGVCNDTYVLSQNITLTFNGTEWEAVANTPKPDTTPVTFTNINPTWNDNTDILNNGFHYTVLHLDGLLTSGFLGEGDDWSDALAKATINGGESYFSFSSASYIAGPNVESNFIIIYSATAPTEGDEFVLKAGATFDVGGDDNHLYELTSDICLTYDGTAWVVGDTPVVPDTPQEPGETVSVELTSINGTWNNYDYVDQGYFCSFLHFSGAMGGGSLAGDYTDLLSKMTLDGQPIDTENLSFVCAKWIGAEGGIVMRLKTLPADGSILKMAAGSTFTIGEDANVYELSQDVELKIMNGKWSVPLPTVEFVEVNPWNNNIVTQSGSRLTLLDFNVENLGNAVSTSKNLVAMAGITVNGVKLTDIEGASVTYMHGANHMGIDLPVASVYPTADYPVTVMKVAAGTVFENYELPEITLSLIGGTWIVGEVETMPKEDTYVTVTDLVGADRCEIGADSYMAATEGYEGDVNLKVIYYTDKAIVDYAPYGGLMVYLNSTNLWDGWRIVFVANKVYVYDATMGGVGDEHVLIGEADFGITNGIEMQLEISVKESSGKYSIVIGGSCAKILEINDITPIGDCLGGGIMFYTSVRGCRVKDYKYGDVFDPILTIYSKQEMVLNEGDAVPEIDAVAFDGSTEITPTYVWDEGAITDGKMNAGVWNCVVTATDANGNYVTEIIRVTVKGEAKYTVTFDGANEATYAYGAKIAKPADPTKAATAKVQYTFDGWYVGDMKWDFDNDVVTENISLVAKFVESDVYYKVTVKMSGESDQVLYVTYGAQVDLSAFNKEGYVCEVKKDSQAITSLIVTEDAVIEISYKKGQPQNSSTSGGLLAGCMGSVALSGSAAALLLAGVGMTLRKRRDDDEE